MKLWDYIKLGLATLGGIFLLIFIRKKPNENVAITKKEIDLNKKEVEEIDVKNDELIEEKEAILDDIKLRDNKIEKLKRNKNLIEGEDPDFDSAYKHLKNIANE